jgi:hypothetical protein
MNTALCIGLAGIKMKGGIISVNGFLLYFLNVFRLSTAGFL